jgi:NADH-quinone oxidoreductase subunit M
MEALAAIPYLISVVTFVPTVGMLLVLVMRGEEAIRWTALATTVVTFVASIGLWGGFDPATSNAQMIEMSAPWLPGFDVKYFVGVDGLNLLLILLTTLLGPIVVLCSWTYIKKYVRGYYALLLLLQTGIVGVFASFDLLLFYVFFELTLIPMYFIIGIWGGENRIYAAIKFVLFTLVGSLLMLVGILYLGYAAGGVVNDGVFTTDWFKLLEYGIPPGEQIWLFCVFALAFAIKVPLFPLHTWLPDAHVQAPTGGSVILAGVLLKMGTYGLVRFCLPFFPNAAHEFAMFFAIIAVIGIVYGALVAAAQKDAKKLIAYSSVSHLGFVVLGIFAFNVEALQGAMIQMVNHGLSTGALFLIVGMLYERRHTRMMEDYGGIARSVPVLSFFMIVSVLASVGLPGLNGFVGEFLILLGTFSSDVIGRPVLVAVATTGVIFAAYYLLWFVHKIFFGTIERDENRVMPDLNLREIALLVPLVIFMVWIGIAPAKFLEVSEVSTNAMIETVEIRRMAMEENPTERRIIAKEEHLASR